MHPLLAEIDLQLVARRRFDAHRRQRAPPAAPGAVGATARSMVRTLPVTAPLGAAAAARRPHCPRPAPSYSVRASARDSSVSRRAARVGPARPPIALPQIPPHRITRDADLARNRLLAEPATRQLRIAVTISPSTTGTSAVGDTNIPPRAPFDPPPEGVRISVARGSISLSLYRWNLPVEYETGHLPAPVPRDHCRCVWRFLSFAVLW